MRHNLEVKSWVEASGECPISYRLDGSGEVVDFVFGDPPSDFEFGFDERSLREFLKVGKEALREMVGYPSTR